MAFNKVARFLYIDISTMEKKSNFKDTHLEVEELQKLDRREGW
jgi:hypothetical protein